MNFSFVNGGLGDSFADALGDGLHHSVRLHTLDLSRNQIGDEGASSIAAGLIERFNGHLKRLDLSRNRIRDEGGRRLATMLAVNRSIKHCLLSYNQMGEIAGEEFVRALKTNSVVEHIDVNCNLFTLR